MVLKPLYLIGCSLCVLASVVAAPNARAEDKFEILSTAMSAVQVGNSLQIRSSMVLGDKGTGKLKLFQGYVIFQTFQPYYSLKEFIVRDLSPKGQYTTGNDAYLFSGSPPQNANDKYGVHSQTWRVKQIGKLVTWCLDSLDATLGECFELPF
ncbi:hypothetical protein ACU8OS_35285 (plasmid) [Rhizobium leguminosarum]